MREKLFLMCVLFFSMWKSYAQPSEIVGTVIEAQSKLPLAGVTVRFQGETSTSSTSTDESGRFVLKASEAAGNLSFSLVGYLAREVVYPGVSLQTIALTKENTALDEVVVVGYGTVRKRDLTGSVVSVKGDEIAKVPSANIIESIQGKVPGVDITRSSGSASSGVSMTVRGNRSITAQNGPLFIVDGVQYSNIQDINPNDIESMEILKDASSTAIYGSRGANGVVIVTTKKGKAGQARVSVNSYAGVSKVDRYPSVMNLEQWVKLRREAYRTTGRWNSEADDDKAFNNAELEAIRNNDYIDYFDLLVKDGMQQNYQVSINGGSDKTTVYFSGDYMNERGVFDMDMTNRFGGRLNIDQKLGDYFKAGMQAQVTRYEIDKRRDPLNQANKINPLGRVYDDAGKLIMYPLSGSAISPLADMEPNAYKAEGNITRTLTNAYVELTNWKGFSGKSTLGVTFTNTRDGSYAGSYTIDRNGSFSKATYDAGNSYLINMENVLSYQKEIEDHNFTLTAVNSFLWNRSDNINASGEELLLDGQLFYALGNARRNLATNTNYSMNNLVSFAGRLNYAYKGKYLLTATGRTDGSSILAQGRKWAFFPSVAAAWRMVDENFMADQNTFSELKLRASYGKAGNYAVDPYSTQNSLTRVAFGWDEEQATGYTFSPRIGNYGLGWEITATTNIGVDFGFLQNRINASIDLYDSRTSDLLLERGLPPTTGVTSVIQNVGKTRNRGVEIAVNADLLRERAFNWNSGLSFTSNKEEIVELVTKDDDIGNGWFIGHPTSVFYDYDKVGIWQLGEEAEAAKWGQEPGDIRVKDINGDGKIDASSDRIILGSPRPKWLIGWDNTFTYKGFDLNVYIFARWGQLIQPNFLRRYDPQGLGQSTAAIDYWTPENPTNAYPRPNSGTSLNSMLYTSTLGYVDGSFIRVRNLSLGYTFDSNVLRSGFVKNLRVYGTARNPFTWTKANELKEYDPERGGSENFPMTKLFVFGVNIGF
ncbi:SusC/RagA family TonB-linked outer membrane protein [Sphingobacterium sp. FBM7-1]|uniref:SusC/RagA family TonB-linked outer membrane protein n=1 Tax=Sphingobacterium sp. FBM7-1 TaxID=2886688 RepID=UPI001D110399|nr:TonB-dependent receptor [Sphingobacterium sp. FBM7-1]MCC2600660.1 TonB-dependent receptor [Sphingobacterium sp. FBM7-1]